MEGEEKEKKGLLKKLKDGIEDQEAQIQILGTFVRLGVVVWSGFIITLNYVDIPMVKKLLKITMIYVMATAVWQSIMT